jgi:hypothetical protein
MKTMNRIIYPTPEGGGAVIIPAESVEAALKDVPEGVDYEIIEEGSLPADRFFRNAWVKGNCCVDLDLDKCKEIGHECRRAARAEEFAPYDDAIVKQIPGTDVAKAESERQKIRDKYAQVQEAINAAATPEEIKTALNPES